jgi:hypothetical protein
MQTELCTRTERKASKNLKQTAREACMVPGTAVCSGCGGVNALRLAAKVFGPKTVFITTNLCAIWQAHHPASLDTVSACSLVDLTNTFLKVKTRHGP